MKSKTLFFAKIPSKSSGMSHLVEQVRRTAELLFSADGAYRKELTKVVQEIPQDSRYGLAKRKAKARRLEYLSRFLRKAGTKIAVFCSMRSGKGLTAIFANRGTTCHFSRSR